MKNSKHIFLKSLLKGLTTPAYGCTEIGAVAYACAMAAITLKSTITKADVYVSPYIYRNDANVGVPHMGKVGIETIAAAGFVVKQPKDKLAVLSTITEKQCQQAKALAKKNIINVNIDLHCDPVFVKVVATDKNNNVCDVLIEVQHDVIKRVKLNNTIVSQQEIANKKETGKLKFNVNDISLEDIYQCVSNAKIEELKFLKKGIEMNHRVMQHGLKKGEDFTSATNKTMHKNWQDNLLLSTTAAIGSRMLGCPLPVMASNDSGDHGLTVNLPQYIYHTSENTSELVMYQAIALSNLITWKIKKNIGSLSAYCGSVIAATTATICGIGFQKKFNIKQINDLINFCLCSFAGTLCDGAKLSCAWKVQSALLIGFQALRLVENNSYLPNNEGLVNKDAFETIKHLGKLSKAIMDSTNNELVSIIQLNKKDIK